MQMILGRAEVLRQALTQLADEDARAYAAVAASYRLPKGTDEDRSSRQAAIQQALRAASIPPLAAMEACRAILPLSLQVAAHGNPTVVSDAGVAAELAVAGVRASIVNVRVNLADLKDAEHVAAATRRIAAAEEGLADEVNRVAALVRAKLAPKATA
jgi:formiminotetrahydrofolate cyclodeaminase